MVDRRAGAEYLREVDFPEDGSLADQLRHAVRYAVLAPSEHNTQPWRFRVAEDRIELRLDPTRTLETQDPVHRVPIISCGIALFYLRLALRHFGLRTQTQLLPHPDDRELLALTTVVGEAVPSQREDMLFGAILRRGTQRGRFATGLLPEDLKSELLTSAADEGAWMAFPDGGARDAVADLVATADHWRFADGAFRRELAGWLHDGGEDGVPLRALGVPPLLGRLARRALVVWDPGPFLASRDRAAVLSAPALAVVGTDGDRPSDWINAGQALGHGLLRAAADGVAARYFNRAVELPELRQRLADVIGGPGVPQVLFALGRARALPATPRRAAEAVIVA